MVQGSEESQNEVVQSEVVNSEVVQNKVGQNEVVQNKVYSKFILFTEVKNDSNVAEWVEHHIKIGFSHIYMIDYGFSRGKLDHIQKEKLTVIYSKKHIQNILLQAHQFSVKYGFDWMLYLTSDEYLRIDNISTFLQNKNEDKIDIEKLVQPTPSRPIFFLKL